MILNITIKRICRNSGIHPLLLDFVFISYRSLVTSFELYLTRFIGITIHLRWYYDVYGTKAQIVSKIFFLCFITTRFLELKVGQPAFHLPVYLLTWGMGSAFSAVKVQDILLWMHILGWLGKMNHWIFAKAYYADKTMPH